MAIGKYTVTKVLRFTPRQIRDIEDFRFAQRYGTATDAIRDLIDAGLKALGFAVSGETENE